jgi:hypothetical protein
MVLDYYSFIIFHTNVHTMSVSFVDLSSYHELCHGSLTRGYRQQNTC